MKTVFNNRELCHVFASQSQDEGRGSNMSFRGGVLYSYSTAIYRIAQFKGKQYLIENSNNFSSTTSKHKNYAWRALHHIEPCFSVDRRRGTDLYLSPKDIVKEYAALGDEKTKETHKLRRKQYEIFLGAKHHYQEAHRAAKFFGMGTAKLKKAIAKMEELAAPYREDYEKFHAASEERSEKAAATRRINEQKRRQEEIEQRQVMVMAFLHDHTVTHVPAEWTVKDENMEAYKAKLKKREEWKLEQRKELMEGWMKGDQVDTWELRDLPVRLRVSEDEAGPEPGDGSNPHSKFKTIETSHGAVIPYEDGRRAFRFIQRHKGKAWRRNGEQCPVGHYQIDSILEDGSIVAGCHRILWDEIVRFAQQEGWVQSTEGDS